MRLNIVLGHFAEGFRLWLGAVLISLFERVDAVGDVVARRCGLLPRLGEADRFSEPKPISRWRPAKV
jgi:hypothetical protein